MKSELATLAEDPNNQEALKKLVENLKSFFTDVFEDVTDNAVCKVENGFLNVNVSMVPTRFLGGGVTIQRSKDEGTKGPIFALRLKLEADKLDPATITKDFFRTTQVHIEGYANIFMFCSGYVKFLINQQGYKFYMEFAAMTMWKLFKAEGLIGVSDTDVTQAKGALATWFTKEWADKVAQYIKDAAAPLTSEFKKAKDALEAEKAKCPSIPLVTQICEGAITLAQGALDLVKQGLGGALDAVAFLVEEAGDFLSKIFQIDEASFDLVVKPDDPGNTCLDLVLKGTVLGNNINEKVNVCLNDLEKEIDKIAKKFADTIFAELTPGKNPIVDNYAKENPPWDRKFR